MSIQTKLRSRMMHHFKSCEDPRKHRIRHQLIDVIVITVLATVCGEDGWEGFYEWASDKQDYLKQFLSLKNGIPCPDTFRRVIERLNSQQFMSAFASWTKELKERLPGQICLDGKAFRGVGDKNNPLRVVSAWCEKNQMLLGMSRVGSKSNEIVGIHTLLDTLLLKPGDLITIDAIGCQRSIVEKITEKKADYLVTVKQNQPGLWDELHNYFTQATTMPAEARCDGISHAERGRGRKETHHIWSTSDLEWLPQLSKWVGLKSAVCVYRRWVEGKKTKEEKRYYITSLEANAEELRRRIRRHWSVENEFHWHLDVAFGEDDSRIGEDANENLRVARAIALQLLKAETTFKKGIKAKMRKCHRSESYLHQVLLVGNF
ncbi:MAG: ISAs1 family transposase [Rhabdochlamydiaceae bacterium]|nr:ISAs1 family transposase [Candidatus Amphrikana amoebophyrae]